MRNAKERDEKRIREALDDYLGPIAADPELADRVLAQVSRRRGFRGFRGGGYAAVVSVTAAAAAVILYQGVLAPYASQREAADIAGKYAQRGTSAEAGVSAGPSVVAAPPYIPDSYAFKEAESTVDDRTDERVLKLRFESGDGETGHFELIRSKATGDVPDGEWRAIGIGGGISGSVMRSDDGVLTLIWEDGDYRYKLIGTLSEDEAGKVADSLVKESEKR